MKTAKLVIGILIVVFSSIFLLLCGFILISTNMNEVALKYTFYSAIGIIIGVFLICSSESKNEKAPTYVQHQYTEEERRIYFRNANAHGKPITEYQMDERTKMITYYDRMPYSYQKKLSDYADTLYRRYENEEYLKK